MRKTATRAGSGQQAKSDLIVPATSQAVLDLESHSGWTEVPAEAADQSQDTASDPSDSVAAGSNETAQEPVTLPLTQVRNVSKYQVGDWVLHVTRGLGEVRRIPSAPGAEGVAVEVRFQGQTADATVACVELQAGKAPDARELGRWQAPKKDDRLPADAQYISSGTKEGHYNKSLKGAFKSPVAAGSATRPKSPATKVSSSDSKAIRLTPAQVMKRLPEEVGTLRLNTRSQDITAGGVVMTGNAIARLYLQLSSSAESWPKEASYDAAVLLAEQNSYDPVADYLNSNIAAPLPMEQWQRLDQCLLGIDDHIAASFLPRYLIAAVARTFAPGCDFRQTPVLVGPQWIGKTALGRILFGTQHFISGVGDLGKDSLERCHTAWGIELAELDGITRRSDQEALKAFLSETCDSWRSPYDKATERRPRRFLFWGTSNGAALRDTTGNTRFVCIRVEQPLPLDWAEQNRAAIWSRAFEQYQAGVSWQECDAAERSAIADRNDNYQEQDPWLPVVMQHLEHSAAEQRLPVQVPELLTRIGVPRERQSAREAKRVQQLAESLGWQQDRRQVDGKRVKGLWPLPHLCHTSATPPNTNQRSGSEPAATPATPERKELLTREQQKHPQQQDSPHVGTYGQVGVAGVAFAPDANQRSCFGGVARGGRGVALAPGGVAAAPATIPGFIDPTPAPVGSGADAFDDDDDPAWG